MSIVAECLISSALRTTTKVRILAGQLHSTRQQVIRIDYEGEPLNDAELRARLRDSVLEHTQAADAVIISDYNYGVADAEHGCRSRATLRRRERFPCWPTRAFGSQILLGSLRRRQTRMKSNNCSERNLRSLTELETASEELRDRLGYRALLVTRGSNGMMLLEDGVAAVHLEAVGCA